ncbi:hypothetical protein [Streptomyces sp. NBRC 109706]|uniref:hypothetical protein n=1 Tax=Streptomyces sp. NBRC 109706 TaxID=1550035 RepID=UPI000785027E|nr:hypothetical protein [Streptomyces sp. NBRC 109706]
MMIYLQKREIDLNYEQEDPLRLVAEMEKAVRRHDITLTDIGVDSRYLDMYSPSISTIRIELGSCRGEQLERLIEILNQAPVREKKAQESYSAG